MVQSVRAGSDEIIRANRDCYVNSVVFSGDYKAGEIIFALNSLELDRETIKLAVELMFMELTERRLSPNYIDKYILRPMRVAVDYAEADVAGSEAELQAALDSFNVGSITRTDVAGAEVQLNDRVVLREKAQINLLQRELEIETQRRRLKSELIDLEERIALNAEIKKLSQFRLANPGNVRSLVYSGAFVEEGDTICEVSYR